MNKKNLKKTLAAIAVLGLVSQETPASNLPVMRAGADPNLSGTSLMNQLVLSQESIASEYSRIRLLSAQQRRDIANMCRSNFAGFMRETFYLTSNQNNCLTNYWTTAADIEFINFLAARIEAGDAITWYVDLTNADAPPFNSTLVAPKKRKLEGGYSEKDGWFAKFGLEW